MVEGKGQGPEECYQESKSRAHKEAVLSHMDCTSDSLLSFLTSRLPLPFPLLEYAMSCRRWSLWDTFSGLQANDLTCLCGLPNRGIRDGPHNPFNLFTTMLRVIDMWSSSKYTVKNTKVAEFSTRVT